jgi:uncharacterized protein
VDALILDIDALEEANRPFEADLPREFLDSVLRADPPTEFHANGASHLAGRTTKMGEQVLVQAKFNLPLTAPCKRCLKPVTLDEPVEMTRTFVPAGKERAPEPKKDEESQGSFDPALADEDTYSGKELDLTQAVREQVLLSVPSSPLCDEACKGLCPKCGKDLNEGECGCDRTVLDPRWAALQDINLTKEK